MRTNPIQNGPWAHQFLIYLFAGLFGLLIFWLLGFAMRDIATWPGPTFQEVHDRLVDKQAQQEGAELAAKIEQTQREIENQRRRQAVLRDSTSNSEKTMNQLMELQKLTLQKSGTVSEAETQAMAESQRLFLANQANYQQLNEQISALGEELTTLQGRQRELQKKVEAELPEIQKAFAKTSNRHQWKLASAKLAVLLPLLGAAVWFFLKWRNTIYVPLVHGFGLAVLVRVGLVMHEHFPARFFKYILIVVSLALVTRILIYLLRARAFPKPDWLLKQYREAYEHFLCPRCSHPIRRGPLKYSFWTRRSIKKLQLPDVAKGGAEEPYVCPVCTTTLFEECPKCKAMRHSLLPACSHCGTTKDLAKL